MPSLGYSIQYMPRFLFISLVFMASTSLLWMIVLNRPNLDSDEQYSNLRFPTCLEDVKALFKTLGVYKEDHWCYVYILFSISYIFKQSFAIPGSVLLNILAGALFGCFPYGLLLCCALTSIGATNCYLLSQIVGKELIYQYFPSQVTWLREKISENESKLPIFLIGLRLFPIAPNWLINIISPIVNVPLHLFFISVFIGLLPYNFLCIQAGETLSEINSMDDIFTPKRILLLMALATFIFSISYFTDRRKEKLKK